MTFPDLLSKENTEAVDPMPDCFVADIYAPVMEQVLDIA